MRWVKGGRTREKKVAERKKLGEGERGEQKWEGRENERQWQEREREGVEGRGGEGKGGMRS